MAIFCFTATNTTTNDLNDFELLLEYNQQWQTENQVTDVENLSFFALVHWSITIVILLWPWWTDYLNTDSGSITSWISTSEFHTGTLVSAGTTNNIQYKMC